MPRTDVAIKTREPVELFVTANVMSHTTTGFAPAASQTRTRENCIWFCPAPRMRSWIA